MQSEPIIRPVRAEEMAAAKRLVCEVAHGMMEPQMSFEDFLALWNGRGIFRDLDDIQKNYFDSGGVFEIVEVDGQMVGTGSIKQYTEGYYFEEGGELRSTDERLRTGKGVCEVRRIALLPEYRGKRLGYLLMLDLIRRAREMGYTLMMLWTNSEKLHRAVDFYHQMGFYDLPVEGLNPDELWMAMELGGGDVERPAAARVS